MARSDQDSRGGEVEMANRVLAKAEVQTPPMRSSMTPKVDRAEAIRRLVERGLIGNPTD
jgi:hypothetical protein